MSFARLLFEAMAGHGDRPALVSDREELTHGRALEQAGHLAANMAAAGIRPGDRVGLAVQDTLEAFLSILACWRLDATPAMIDFRAPRPERARLARDFGLAIIVESRSPPGDQAYPAMAFDRGWRFSSREAGRPRGAAECANPAFLMFSSGTTGDPKAYVQTHEGLLRRLAYRGDPAGAGPPRYLSAMTLSYSATRHQVLGYLFRGGVVRLFAPLFSTSELIEGLLAFGATATGQPPPVIARIVREAGERPDVLFPALRTLNSMGGPARPEDKAAAWRNLTRGYTINYAASLTGRISTLAGADVPSRPETAGRLVDGVRVDILGHDGEPLPQGETGVIRAWTPSMAAAVLLPGGAPFVDPKVMGEGWGIPGDVGFLDGDGFLTIVDRLEDMIVRGGVSVAPQELEKLIRSHPKIADVAVAGVPDAVMGQEIAAFLVPKADVTVAELRAFLAANVSPEKRPREIRLVAALPYSANGKLLRRRLVEDLAQE